MTYKVGDRVLIKHPDCLLLFGGNPGTGRITKIYDHTIPIHYYVQLDGYDQFYVSSTFLSPFEQPTDILKDMLK